MFSSQKGRDGQPAAGVPPGAAVALHGLRGSDLRAHAAAFGQQERPQVGFLICSSNFPRIFQPSPGYREVVEMILKTGFDINVRTSRGTALHEAAICGKVGRSANQYFLFTY